MISKEVFCKALTLIREQEAIDHEFGQALNLVGDGHYAYGTGNKYLEALRLVLKAAIDDKYDYIGWWLYEGEPDYEVWTEDESMKWVLKAPEALYDYLTGELPHT